MLKLGCTLSTLVKLCVHKSTGSNFFPFTERDKDSLQEIREDMVGGPSNMFTRKALVVKTIIQNLTNQCKLNVCNGANQLYPYSMCKPMPTGFYTRWYRNTDLGKFTPRQNKYRIVEYMAISFFQQMRPDCKNERFYTAGTVKKITISLLLGFVLSGALSLKLTDAFTIFAPQEVSPSLSFSDEDIQPVVKREN